MTELTHRTLKGFAFREAIGSGGFGTVYRAYQPAVDREVAIKVIRPEYANHPDFIRRFETEAQIVARLEHPHIVPLYDFWRDPSGAYLVMRWLPRSLRMSLNEGRWDLETIVQLVEQIAGALAVAHRQHIVHRDIKPDNILLDEDRNAYLADFGIAKVLDVRTESGLSQQLAGSPLYISPEQIRSEVVSPQTDLYSLGVVLYELLTGEKPFPEATTPTSLIYKHLNEPLPSVRHIRVDIPPAVDGVIQTATAKTPSERYPDAARLAAAFRAAAAIARPVSDQPLPEPLTTQELKVLRLMMDGCSNSEIAERLFLTPGTVKWYLKQIYSKLDVHGREQAIERAHMLHLTDERRATPIPPTVEGTVIPQISGEEAALPRRAVQNPYKGLQAFQEADAADFFGREALTAQLVNRLGESGPFVRFLAVVGPSGSGKSSVVKAGLLPALRKGALSGSEQWYISTMLPGAHPLEEVELALTRVAAIAGTDLLGMLHADKRGLLRAVRQVLPDNGSQLLLVIDQFEEVFTLVEHPEEAAHFLDSLYAAVTDAHSPLRAVITLRADFYDRPLMYPDFSEMVSQRTLAVTPLRPEEIEQVVVRPAQAVGIDVEPGLTAAIIAEVNEQPGALPLLQYALTELFEGRDSNTLTKARYDALGGTLGALARRADEVYTHLSTSEQAAARQVFLRLVTLGEGTEDTRRRALENELLSVGDATLMQGVIDAFDHARLLTFDRDPVTRGPTVEVAHEALLREWKHLRAWLDESRDEMRLQRMLASAAHEWLSAKRDASYLLTGSRLTQFEDWQAHSTVNLTENERDFLVTSTTERQRQIHLEREQQLREARLRRRIQQAIGVIAAVSLLAALISAILALIATDREQKAQIAQAQAAQAAADFRLLALVNASRAALSAGDTDTALLLALEANQGANPPGFAQMALSEAAYRPGTVRSMPWGYYFASVNPSGKLMTAAGGNDRVWSLIDIDPASTHFGKVLATQPIAAGYKFFSYPIFSPDGKLAFFSFRVTDAPKGEAFLMNTDAASPDFLKVNRVDVEDANQVFGTATFGADSRTLLLGGCASPATVSSTDNNCENGGTLVAWEVNPATLSVVKVRNRAAFDTVISGIPTIQTDRSGTRGCIKITNRSNAISFLLISLDPDSADFGRVLHTFGGLTKNYGACALSPDGQTALVADGDQIGLWDLGLFQLIRTFEVPGTSTSGYLEFHPGGQFALLLTGERTILIYEVASGKIIAKLAGHSRSPAIAHFLHEGMQVISSALDSTRLWDIQRGNVLQTFQHFLQPGSSSEIVHLGRFSLDGKMLLLAANCMGECTPQATTAALYNVTTGAELRRFTGYPNPSVDALEFSLDGTKALIAAGQNKIWDLTTGQVVSAIESPQVNEILPILIGSTFRSDNKTLLAVVDQLKQAVVWDITQNPARELKRIPAQPFTENLFDAVLVEGSSQTLLFAATMEDNIVGWDVETAQPVVTLTGLSVFPDVLAPSPDKRRLLSGSSDKAIVLWDIDPSSPGFGQIIRRFIGQPSEVTRLAFSTDGRYVFADSATEGIRQWDTETGDMVRHYENFDGVFPDPDGRSFLSFSVETSQPTLVRIDTLEELKTWIRQHRYVRDFTCEERAQYNIEPLCPKDGTK